jgi:hypothetical protein
MEEQRKDVPHFVHELCRTTLRRYIVFILSVLVMKQGVMSIILRPNTSPWSGNPKIPQAEEAMDIKVQGQNGVDLIF